MRSYGGRGQGVECCEVVERKIDVLFTLNNVWNMIDEASVVKNKHGINKSG